MNRRDAEALVKLLVDAFQRKMEEGTYRVYVEAFEKFTSVEVGYETVRDIIDTSERFPAIATIRQTYIGKRNRQIEGEQRLALEAEYGDVRDVPAAVKDFLRGMEERAKQLSGTFSATLPGADAGTCDDCAKETNDRRQYGSFQLCRACVALRLSAAAKSGGELPMTQPAEA